MSSGLREDRNVLIVAASKWAYHCFHRYSAYICQPDRHFRSESIRLGYYADREIMPEFPRILLRRSRIAITQETVKTLRASGSWQDAAFAVIVEELVADGRHGTESQIFLLTGPNDPQTLRIAQPIRHATSGRGTAWTQGQRYVSETAILAEPPTTAALMAAEDSGRREEP